MTLIAEKNCCIVHNISVQLRQFSNFGSAILQVELSKEAKKAVLKAPRHIAAKLLAWVDLVESEGLEEARIRPGFHDEPLRGILKGKRSIRLSLQWRAIYSIKKDKIEFILVEKVTPHEYKK